MKWGSVSISFHSGRAHSSWYTMVWKQRFKLEGRICLSIDWLVLNTKVKTFYEEATLDRVVVQFLKDFFLKCNRSPWNIYCNPTTFQNYCLILHVQNWKNVSYCFNIWISWSDQSHWRSYFLCLHSPFGACDLAFKQLSTPCTRCEFCVWDFSEGFIPVAAQKLLRLWWLWWLLYAEKSNAKAVQYPGLTHWVFVITLWFLCYI